MVARAQAAADSDVCLLIDAEIVLLPEFIDILTRLSKVDHDWFLVSLSHNIANFRHHQLVDIGSHWVQRNGKGVRFKKVALFVHQG
jgi:beta-arabinofuranosyltransferase